MQYSSTEQLNAIISAWIARISMCPKYTQSFLAGWIVELNHHLEEGTRSITDLSTEELSLFTLTVKHSSLEGLHKTFYPDREYVENRFITLQTLDILKRTLEQLPGFEGTTILTTEGDKIYVPTSASS